MRITYENNSRFYILIQELIRDKSSTGKVPFNITGMTINPHDPNVSVDWLSALLTDALENQEWHKSKRVKAATSSIDHIALGIMRNPGTNPEGCDCFGIREDDPVTKMAIFRLIDLGIMRFHSAVRENLPEHTYRWTPFGYAVMKHLGFTKLTMEEFKNSPRYQKRLEDQEEYEKWRREQEK